MKSASAADGGVPHIQYCFRSQTEAPLEPEPGEAVIAHAESPKRLALDALESGLSLLRCGTGPVSRLVLETTFTSPTLDDMLAAAILRKQLLEQPLPEGVRAFAEYAALVRQGLDGASVPPERSLEGVYLAVRNLDGADLAELAGAERFLPGWYRLERHILAVAEEGKAPFQDLLFEGPEWARERIYLARDREVYQRDVRAGRRWLITGLGAPAAGLVLFEPKSLLFKHWCREDEGAPVAGGYLFLAVRWQPGKWVFSTAPHFRISLKPLCLRLQQAELRREAAGPVDDPWFEGGPFAHTLIAAPRQGSAIPEQELLRVVADWLEAKPSEDQLPSGVAEFFVAWPIAGLSAPEIAWRSRDGVVFRAFDRRGHSFRVQVTGLSDAAGAPPVLVRSEREALETLEEKLRGSSDARSARLLRFLNHRELSWRGRNLLCSVGPDDLQSSLAAWRYSNEQPRLGAIVTLLADVAEGLSLLHDWGRVHGDLHAENVFVALKDGQPRAVVGSLAGAVCSRRAGFENINYSPPILQEADPSRDVFALAILSVFVVRGHLDAPFRDRANGTLSPDVFAAVVAEELGASADWLEKLRRLVLRAGAFDSRLRPTALEFRAELLAFSQDLCTLETSALPRTEGTSTWARQQDEVETDFNVLGLAGETASPIACARCARQNPPHAHSCVACGTLLPLLAHGASELDATAAEKLVGRKLQGYGIECILGKGGMGIVYRARQLRLDREVAVKVLPPSRSRELQLVTLFEQEAKVLAALDHPHIVPIYDMFEADGFFCIVMALARDGSVRDLLKRQGALPEEDAVDIVGQAALGLFAAAREGIVHRDIKPDNLLLSQGRVRIADFGIACRHGDPDEDIFGTPAYMAPEQWTAFLHATHRSDLYALGCTLFELLTGKTPFRGPGWTAFQKQHLSDDAPDVRELRSEISATRAELVARLLRKDPAKRYATGEELAEALLKAV